MHPASLMYVADECPAREAERLLSRAAAGSPCAARLLRRSAERSAPHLPCDDEYAALLAPRDPGALAFAYGDRMIQLES